MPVCGRLFSVAKALFLFGLRIGMESLAVLKGLDKISADFLSGPIGLELDLPSDPHRTASAVQNIEVQEVGSVGACHITVIAARSRGCIEVLVVGDVEDLATKLEPDTLGDLEGLQEVGIKLEVAGCVVGVAGLNEWAGGRVGRDLNEVHIVGGDAGVVRGVLQTGRADASGYSQ